MFAVIESLFYFNFQSYDYLYVGFLEFPLQLLTLERNQIKLISNNGINQKCSRLQHCFKLYRSAKQYQKCTKVLCNWVFSFYLDTSATCGESQFQCRSTKECIDSRYRCDQYKDCNDNSDEEGCSKNLDCLKEFVLPAIVL